MDIKNRIEKLRALMAQNGIDAYLVPSDDDHASEYVNDHFKAREWITGFTGSAGTALITQDEAFLWTDGRYFLQAAMQLEGTGVKLMKMGEPGVPEITEKLKEYGGITLGFDGMTMTAKEGAELEKICGNIVSDKDLVGAVWEDRPELRPSEIWEFPLSSCGKTYGEKISFVRAEMKKAGAGILLLSDLMETAWLFDLRGGDIQNTPVFYSYAVITEDRCLLFTLPGAVSDALRGKLSEEGVECMDYNETAGVLKELCTEGKTLWADRGKTSYSLLRPLSAVIADKPTPVEMAKAVKNSTEIEATVNAHLKDGAAVTKFIYWLKNTVDKEKLTEISCCDRLEGFRREQEGCFDLSFPTIAGYMENGAIIHYEPEPETDAEVKPYGLLLVDSGGQYTDGTTDITRTIAVGELTEKMKEYYTLVLKGHIDLAMAVFPEGTTGKELDEMTRKPLNERGLDYNHGTGHGVGHVLSVHEGPNYISKRGSDALIVPGMITSDEPGVYIENEFGIRIESEILCVRDGESLAFRVLTQAPLEREAIKAEMLDKKELAWLDSYHAGVYENLKDRLTPEEAAWLRKVTAPLSDH